MELNGTVLRCLSESFLDRGERDKKESDFDRGWHEAMLHAGKVLTEYLDRCEVDQFEELSDE